ncbi:hypothetical protein PG988_010618 [Apiospora saccharicola]
MKTFGSILVIVALAMCAAAMPPPGVIKETPCTSGTPTTTAGYSMGYFHATPTQFKNKAYQPEAAWAKNHIKGTMTYGVSEPTETGFAYAQFKCQFKCNSWSASSFFVKWCKSSPVPPKVLTNWVSPSFHGTAGGKDDAMCTCYSDLMDPDTFVSDTENMVGAWNSLCK